MNCSILKFLMRLSPNSIFALVEREAKELKEALITSQEQSKKLFETVKHYENSYLAYRQKQYVLYALEQCTSDLQWAKDLNGRYLYANESIKKKLLNCDNPIGLSDIEIAEGRRRVVGTDNHTAGEVCFGSDCVIIKNELPQRFLEEFIINGKRMILEVNKAPMFNSDGELIGTAGTGRDITERYEMYENLIAQTKTNSRREVDRLILNYLEKEMELYHG